MRAVHGGSGWTLSVVCGFAHDHARCMFVVLAGTCLHTVALRPHIVYGPRGRMTTHLLVGSGGPAPPIAGADPDAPCVGFAVGCGGVLA